MQNRERNLARYEWAIERRGKSQDLLLQLYRYSSARPGLADDAQSRRIFGLLVGAGFSLWRAAFLAMPQRDWGGNPCILRGAEDLLEHVLESNEISFGDERRAEDWYVGYYLNNAFFRIESAIRRLPQGERDEALSRFLDQQQKGITSDSPQDIWDIAYSATVSLLGRI